MSNARIPLCIDLDGTLIYGDTLEQSIRLLMKSRPHRALWLGLVWLLRGIPAARVSLTKFDPLDPASLEYNAKLLDFIRTEKQSGREVLLVTGSHQSVADRVSAHVGLFDRALGTTAKKHLVGEHKAEALVDLFGQGGFDYAGNEARDLLVWKMAHGAIVVNADESVRVAARKMGKVVREF